MDFSKQNDKTITIKANGTIHHVFVSDMIYLEYLDKEISLYLNNQEQILKLKFPLNEIEKKLNGDGFIRIDRNKIVNLKYFDKIDAQEKRCFILKNGKKMNVSRRKWCNIKEITQNMYTV